MQYKNPTPIDRKTAIDIFASNNTENICQTLLSVAFYEPDWRWTQERCLELLSSDNCDISLLAVTCLGHIARIHKILDKDKVISALHLKISSCKAGKEIIEDALEDIKILGLS